jgi:secondary thiamine-phosphate synthase enzyme
MKIIINHVQVSTTGPGDLINITEKITALLKKTKLQNGQITVFNIGSTAAIATFEFEPGLMKDVQELFENLIPQSKHHHHDETWGDANGFSHLRAMLQGPSLVIPFENGKALLGTWQQVVLAEFDNRPRQRDVVVQILGE